MAGKARVGRPTTSNTKIEEMRILKNVSRQELSEQTGIPKITLDMWAQGKRTPCDVYKLQRIAKALNCSLEDIIEPEENLSK